MEYKLNRTCFAESIVGWETFLTEHPNVPDELRIYNRLATDHPSVGSLQAIVDALRSLDRLGNASMIRIRAGTCCPWVVAFIRWCLGELPNVLLEDGTILVDQPQARVTVVALMKPIPSFFSDQNATMQTEINMATARELDFEIAIYHDLNEPSQLWSCSGRDQKPWFGMVSIKNYGRRRLREYNLVGNQALVQAMSFSLKLATMNVEAQHPLHRLTAFSFASGVLSDAEVNREVELPAELAHHRTRMSLGDGEMKCTLCKFFGLHQDEETPLPMLSDGQDIMSLPLVELHISKLRCSCKCKRCSGDLGSDLAECKVTDFRDILAQLTAEVIALSLFDCTEPILILSGSSGDPGTNSLGRNGFIIAIDELLRGNRRAACTAAEIISVSLSLIGHNANAELGGRRWIASEARGQVIYPQMFDTAVLEPRATLRLGGGPGKLFHEGSKYSMVCGQPDKWSRAGRSTRWYEKPVDRPLNLMPADKLRWQVSKGDGVLYLGCGTTNTPEGFNPYYVLEAVTQSLFIKNCPHPVDKVLNKPDPYSFYTTPMFSLTHNQPVISLTDNQPEIAGSIGVVPVVGNDGLRFFALPNATPGVIRGSSACMKCCLDLCRQAGFRYIVL